MPTYKITTIDGKEIVFEHTHTNPISIANQLRSSGHIEGMEVVAISGRPDKRFSIVILGSAVIAIRPTGDKLT